MKPSVWALVFLTSQALAGDSLRAPDEYRKCSGVFRKEVTSPNIFLPCQPILVKTVVQRWTQLILNELDKAAFLENRFIRLDGYDPIVKRAGDRAAAFVSYDASEREVLFLVIPFNTNKPKVQVVIRRVLDGVMIETDGLDLSSEKELLAIVKGEV